MVSVVRMVRGLLAERGGNVAVVFALAVSSIILIGGGGVDLMMLTNNRKYLQERVDATALDVANGLTSATLSTAQSKAETRLTSMVEASRGTLSAIVATPTDGTLTLSATLTSHSTFLGIIGVPDLVTTVSSTVTWGETSLEVAMVLDTTGSMADNGKIDALKAAAAKMVSSLGGKATANNTVKFALVPFANFVNVGTTYQNASWIDNAGLSPYHAAYFSSSLNRFTIYSKLGKSWPGCVETRPAPYDMDDTAPTASNPSTLFVPSFHPDEPDTGGWGAPAFANSYLNDQTWSSSQITKMTNATKYTSPTGQDYSNSYFYSNYIAPKGPGYLCAVKPVVRLTNSTATVNAAINALTVAGSTNLPEGLAWGWRMLSSKGPFADGADYSSNTLKIVVLLTDGTNSINTFNTDLGGAYSSWGYPYSGRLGSNPGTNMRDGLDAKVRTVCAAIKAKGLKIYTIGLMIDDTAGQQLLSDCSSGSDFYYNSPSASQLDAVFTAIAQKITKLRIAK
ncbi:MAG: pilus assembly protein TadG-related protein [Hyphomicrobiales bacterium]|nr:pilus assembly protein TadG-related protein [Hyphomicrobiales bacterium]